MAQHKTQLQCRPSAVQYDSTQGHAALQNIEQNTITAQHNIEQNTITARHNIEQNTITAQHNIEQNSYSAVPVQCSVIPDKNMLHSTT